MIKKLCIVLLGVLTATSININAAQNVSVKLNGEIVAFDNAVPVVKNNRTLIPLRGLFEKMDYEIDWEPKLKAAILSKGSNTITIRSDKKYIIVNNIQKTIDVPAQIINGRMMIPLRAVADATGAEVRWDAGTKVADIVTNSDMEYYLQLDGYAKSYKEAIEPLSYIEDTITQLNTLSSDNSRSNIKKTQEMLAEANDIIIKVINDVEDIEPDTKFKGFHENALENLKTQMELIELLNKAVSGEMEYAKVTVRVNEILNKTRELNTELSKFSL